NRDSRLGQDRPGVVFGVYNVDRHATFSVTGSQDGLVDPTAIHALAAEFRQPSRMGIQDPTRESAECYRAELPHVASEEDDVYSKAAEGLADRCIELCRVWVRS